MLAEMTAAEVDGTTPRNDGSEKYADDEEETGGRGFRGFVIRLFPPAFGREAQGCMGSMGR